MLSDKIIKVDNCGDIDLSAVNDAGLAKTHNHLKLKKPVVFFFIKDEEMLEILMWARVNREKRLTCDMNTQTANAPVISKPRILVNFKI